MRACSGVVATPLPPYAFAQLDRQADHRRNRAPQEPESVAVVLGALQLQLLLLMGAAAHVGILRARGA